MLVLSRKTDEAIVINNDIQVTVVEIRNGRVRLGIEAPQGIPIRRSELDLNFESDCHAEFEDEVDDPLKEEPPACAMFEWLDTCFDQLHKNG